MKMKSLRVFIVSFVLIVGGMFALGSAPLAYAVASCSLNVNVDNTTGNVSISGQVTEKQPGQDDSQTSIDIYDSSDLNGGASNYCPGGNGCGIGADNSSASYSKNFSNGTYTAYIQGQSTSNPGAITTTCAKSVSFTVNVQQNLPPAPAVCQITSFAPDPANPTPDYGTGTTLQFAFKDTTSQMTNVPFYWTINPIGGTNFPTPSSGTDSSRVGITTGNLTTSQIYELSCRYEVQNGDAVSFAYTTARTTVFPKAPPGEAICEDPAAPNYGSTAPCVDPEVVPGNLCSPMVDYANILGCTDIENQLKASEQECLTWCNNNPAEGGSDGCRYTRGGVDAGKCYRYTGNNCSIEFDQSNFAWLASIKQCVPRPPILAPTFTPSVACVPVGQTSYTGTMTWAPAGNTWFAIYVDKYGVNDGLFEKYVNPGPPQNSSSTSVPDNFQQIGGVPPNNLVLSPGVTYKAYTNNQSSRSEDIFWSVPQCDGGATGYLDAPATNNTCPANFSGWAWDPDFPNGNVATGGRPVTVYFKKDGVLTTQTVVADDYRADLPGDKYHGFTLPTPNEWKDGSSHQISVYARDENGDADGQLIGSPKTIICANPLSPLTMDLKVNGGNYTSENPLPVAPGVAVSFSWQTFNGNSSLHCWSYNGSAGWPKDPIASEEDAYSFTPPSTPVPYTYQFSAKCEQDSELGGLFENTFISFLNPIKTAFAATMVEDSDDVYIRVIDGGGESCDHDGIQDAGEQCDDGDMIDNDECSNSCRLPPPGGVCGDGIVNQGGIEQCDDGCLSPGNPVGCDALPREDGDGCTIQCQDEDDLNPAECDTDNHSCVDPATLVPDSLDLIPSGYVWMCDPNDGGEIVECHDDLTGSKKPIFIED